MIAEIRQTFICVFNLPQVEREKHEKLIKYITRDVIFNKYPEVVLKSPKCDFEMKIDSGNTEGENPTQENKKENGEDTKEEGSPGEKGKKDGQNAEDGKSEEERKKDQFEKRIILNKDSENKTTGTAFIIIDESFVPYMISAFDYYPFDGKHTLRVMRYEDVKNIFSNSSKPGSTAAGSASANAQNGARDSLKLEEKEFKDDPFLSDPDGFDQVLTCSGSVATLWNFNHRKLDLDNQTRVSFDKSKLGDFSYDGRYLIRADDDFVYLHQCGDKYPCFSKLDHSGVHSVSTSSDGKYLLTRKELPEGVLDSTYMPSGAILWDINDDKKGQEEGKEEGGEEATEKRRKRSSRKDENEEGKDESKTGKDGKGESGEKRRRKRTTGGIIRRFKYVRYNSTSQFVLNDYPLVDFTFEDNIIALEDGVLSIYYRDKDYRESKVIKKGVTFFSTSRYSHFVVCATAEFFTCYDLVSNRDVNLISERVRKIDVEWHPDGSYCAIVSQSHNTDKFKIRICNLRNSGMLYEEVPSVRDLKWEVNTYKDNESDSDTFYRFYVIKEFNGYSLTVYQVSSVIRSIAQTQVKSSNVITCSPYGRFFAITDVQSRSSASPIVFFDGQSDLSSFKESNNMRLEISKPGPIQWDPSCGVFLSVRTPDSLRILNFTGDVVMDTKLNCSSAIWRPCGGRPIRRRDQEYARQPPVILSRKQDGLTGDDDVTGFGTIDPERRAKIERDEMSVAWEEWAGVMKAIGSSERPRVRYQDSFTVDL